MPQRKLGAVTGGLAGEPTLVVGPEVLGRKIMVFVKAANDFVSGTIVGFDTKGGACSAFSWMSTESCICCSAA